MWPNVLFLVGSLFCVMACSSSVNLIGVFITGFGEFVPVHLLLLELFDWMDCLSVSLSFVKSVALDARYGVIGRSFTLFNENALPPNRERAWLILFEISGLTDKLVTLPYFGLFLSSILPWLQKKKYGMKNIDLFLCFVISYAYFWVWYALVLFLKMFSEILKYMRIIICNMSMV